LNFWASVISTFANYGYYFADVNEPVLDKAGSQSVFKRT